MSGFTPGPWLFDERNGERLIVGAVGEGVALIPHRRFGLVDPAERQANANLIAAAPCLYDAADWARDALEAILANWVLNPMEDEMAHKAHDKLTEALAKAQGTHTGEKGRPEATDE